MIDKLAQAQTAKNFPPSIWQKSKINTLVVKFTKCSCRVADTN